MDGCSLRSATDRDVETLYAIHRLALKDYVEATWGWDEGWQEEYFHKHFRPTSCQVICRDRLAIGWIEIEDRADEIALVNIEITPDYQNLGIGTQVIQNLLDRASRQSSFVKLQVLKVNSRARSLYEKLGFCVTGETSTHFLMQSVPRTGTESRAESAQF